MLHNRAVFDEEHALLRESVRRFAAAKIEPHFQEWEKAGIIDRSLWRAAGEAGLLGPQVPEQYGGIGGDFRHNAVVIEELAYSGFAGPATDFSVHSDVCCGYLLSYGTEEQKKKWLPRMISGETVCAIAMTEPGTAAAICRAFVRRPFATAMNTLLRARRPLSPTVRCAILLSR